MPKGGPDGGDGGRGGDVIVRVDDSLRDLQAFRRRVHFRAERGGHGEGAQRHGAEGEPLVIGVPPGTQIERWDGTRYDLVAPGQEVTLARGGTGGRGNKRFTSAVRQAPRLAERGLEGEEGAVELHLKLLADVGLVGAPERRQVLADRAPDARPAEDRGLPVHHARAEPRHARGGRPPARDRRHPGADRGRERRRRPRPRLPRPRRAHAAARPRPRPRPARRLGPAREPRGDRARAGRARPAARRAAAHPGASARRTWSSPRSRRRPPRRGARRLPEDVPVLVTSSATREGLEELAVELLRRVPVLEPAPVEAGVDELAEYRVYRPAAAKRVRGRAARTGRVPRHRRRRRPPDRPPRPRERGGAGPRRAPSAPPRRDRGAGGRGLHARRRRRDRAAWSSSWIPARRCSRWSGR